MGAEQMTWIAVSVVFGEDWTGYRLLFVVSFSNAMEMIDCQMTWKDRHQQVHQSISQHPSKLKSFTERFTSLWESACVLISFAFLGSHLCIYWTSSSSCPSTQICPVESFHNKIYTRRDTQITSYFYIKLEMKQMRIGRKWTILWESLKS